MLHPPQEAAKNTNQRREEKYSQKQGLLCPEIFPGVLQNALILREIEGSDDCRNQRNQKKRNPYGIALQFDQLHRQSAVNGLGCFVPACAYVECSLFCFCKKIQAKQEDTEKVNQRSQNLKRCNLS